jgi:hypothetical protein
MLSKHKMLNKMKTAYFVFVTFFSQQLLATENLSRTDHIGTWTSAWTIVPGEKQVLVISKDQSSVFERRFESGSNQVYEGKSIEYLDDLLIIKYHNGKGQLTFKLVMSGWHAFGKYKLYGTMYMYREGTMYNAYTVSLERTQQDSH